MKLLPTVLLMMAVCFSVSSEEIVFTPHQLKEYRIAGQEFEKAMNKNYRIIGHKADLNKDRIVTLEEARFMIDQEVEESETNHNDLFMKILLKRNYRMDMDKDGTLTRDEVLKYMDLVIAARAAATGDQ